MPNPIHWIDPLGLQNKENHEGLPLNSGVPVEPDPVKESAYGPVTKDEHDFKTYQVNGVLKDNVKESVINPLQSTSSVAKEYRGVEIPQGFTKKEFQEFSEAAKKLAREAGLPKGQLAVQGSRVKGTARPLTDSKPSDIDIILKVDKKTFDTFAKARIDSVRPGTKLQKSLIKGAEKGQLSRFAISKDFNKKLFEILAPKSKFDIDFSIVKEGTKMDTPPFIDLGDF